MEALAFRDAEARAINEFQQEPCADLLERGVHEFRELFFGKVFLRKEGDKALGALGHRDGFGGILVENLGTHEVLAEAFEGGEVLANAGGGELLLDFQVPDELFDVCFGERIEGCCFGGRMARSRGLVEGNLILFERFAVGLDCSFGIPALSLQVYQEILDVFV